MEIWDRFFGVVHVQVTSADTAAFLRAVADQQVMVQALNQTDTMTVSFQTKQRDLERLRKLTKRRGEEMKVLTQKSGFLMLRRIFHRPVLTAGMILLLIGSIVIPQHVLFVRVEGNSTVPDRLIIEKAEESGIFFGAARRSIRSEKVKNALLEQIPQLQWAGVNTSGCVATISVRERVEEEHVQETDGISRIVAARDGVIQKITVEKGTGRCVEGQVVKAGDILISGYTDCGLLVQASRAAGEVYAQTLHTVQAVSPVNVNKRGSIQREEKKYSLILGKNKINFYNDSSILDGSCVKIYWEKYWTLPGGYLLPVGIACEIRRYFDDTTVTSDTKEMQSLLEAYTPVYLQSQMIAGQILQQSGEVFRDGDLLVYQGNYVCLEMIGREQSEEFIEQYGESD